VDKVPAGILRTVYSLNPMAGVIGGFRWAILGERAPDYTIGISLLVVLLLLVGGLYYFKRMERTFADVV
jgi:lipopolysaccharide transport system permease protein